MIPPRICVNTIFSIRIDSILSRIFLINFNCINPVVTPVSVAIVIKLDIFAINHEGQIFFASYDDHLIQFKGNQVINVQGFFGDDAIVKIDLNDYRLRYTYNNKLIGEHKCYPWNDSSSLEAKIKIKEQICFDQQADYNYKNRIYTNTEDQIIALEFKIHPNYPSIKIQLKKYDQEIFNN